MSACLRLEDYKKEILSNIRAPGLICPDTFFFLFLTLQVWWAANPC